MNAHFVKKVLVFKKPSGTSRGVLKQKPTYFFILKKGNDIGIGECSPLQGLSIDDRPNYETKLAAIIDEIHREDNSIPEIIDNLSSWPSIRFGLEMAFMDLENGGKRVLFSSAFTRGETGIPINGLIWMGSKENMIAQAKNLLDRGFKCLKMKIGAINFEEELEVLTSFRKEFGKDYLTLRVDANGAFSPEQALEKLKRLSELDLHSIEQPIKAGQPEAMAELCEKTPLDIALDEELISAELETIEIIRPQYIILKPSLIGGFEASNIWIEKAESMNIGWWATSALESNIGLNAISQWTFIKNAHGHQGLGTGSLYTNNIESPLVIKGEHIYYDHEQSWQLDGLL